MERSGHHRLHLRKIETKGNWRVADSCCFHSSEFFAEDLKLGEVLRERAVGIGKRVAPESATRERSQYIYR